jgi:hypothetical protein
LRLRKYKKLLNLNNFLLIFKVYKKKINIKDFEKYTDLFLDTKTIQPRIYEKVNDRWEVSVAISKTGSFDQISFVNGINPLFDYSKIRKEGVPLKTFGGVSSGAKPLIDLHNMIRCIKIYKNLYS